MFKNDPLQDIALRDINRLVLAVHFGIKERKIVLACLVHMADEFLDHSLVRLRFITYSKAFCLLKGAFLCFFFIALWQSFEQLDIVWSVPSVRYFDLKVIHCVKSVCGPHAFRTKNIHCA